LMTGDWATATILAAPKMAANKKRTAEITQQRWLGCSRF
jgi:hypothetical protein